MKRQIIKIDEEKCTGCGLCIPNCPEGAIQVIDNKARLISDLFCDGLGACLGHCPEGAITVEEREAEPYDEYRVMDNVAKAGPNVIKAHLEHLQDHDQPQFLAQAVDYLEKHNIEAPAGFGKEKGEKAPPIAAGCSGGGCPGSRIMDFLNDMTPRPKKQESGPIQSELRQWPVQLQLLHPHAPYFKNADLVIAADCVPFAFGDFHRRFLKGKVLIIFCPKLDKTIEQYIEKLAEIFRHNDIKSLTLVHMEVPCCFGVERVVTEAMQRAGVNTVIKDYTISIRGEII